jgi:thiamine-phosphate pyrophosphorylase
MKYFQYHMISDRHLLKSCSVADVAAAADRAGVEYFQLREKDLSPRELLQLARQIRPFLQRTLLIVNGSLDVALASHADGVHLQRGNIPVRAVRAKCKDLRIGYSAHSFAEMMEAERQGADYVFISPVFRPFSKSAGDAPPLGTKIVGDWTKSLSIPVFALGGISSTNVEQLKDCGCRGVAGISLFLREGSFTPDGMVS